MIRRARWPVGESTIASTYVFTIYFLLTFGVEIEVNCPGNRWVPKDPKRLVVCDIKLIKCCDADHFPEH